MFPVLGGDDPKIVLSPEGVVLWISPGTESSYPRPPQSLKHSSFLDTLIKTGSESIEATLRRRRTLFAGFAWKIRDSRSA